MRAAGKGPLESLYFTYPHFEPPTAAEVAARGSKAPVAIVGAGPVGMTAALTLARYGIRSVLLDRKPTFNDGSRATCVSRSSMQVLQQIGAVAPYLEHALGWRHGRSYFRDHQIYRLEMPHSDNDKYLPMYNLQQQYIEQYLWDAVAAAPLIDARWQTEATAITRRDDGVTLSVASPNGRYDLDAAYVLAADGARSGIRQMLDLRLAGDNYVGHYVIADVQMKHDFPTERRAFFEPAGNPGGTVLIHRQPDDIWRVDYQLRPGESEAEAIEEPNVRSRVAAILADIGHTGPWELEWWSIYTANTLCLDEYKHGRVIFIGDSAHIVPIFGVRGLNNGLSDAHNIGWKLGLVLNGEADARLLDSYTPERRGATLDVFANATKSTQFMTPPTRGWKLAREAALSLAIHHEFPRGLANPRQMQPYTYASSPLSRPGLDEAAFPGGPVCGAACPNVKIGAGRFLLDLAGDGFTGLLFVDRPLDTATLALLSKLKTRDRRFTPIVIAPAGADVPGATIVDHGGDAQRLYGAAAGTFYLLRPDLHVVGRWRHIDAAQVIAALHAGLGGTS